MPSEPVIVPPTPTINQSDSQEQIAHTVENVQKIFDKVSPHIRGTPTPEKPVSAPEPEKPKEATASAVEPAKEPASPTETPSKESPQEHKIPSFVDKALEAREVKTQSPPEAHDEDWPEELPTFKSSDEAKQRYKAWRQKYNELKEQTKSLSERAPVDETRVKFLEEQNKQMQETLTRMGVETHQEFQQKILAPMHAAWNEAQRIINESGGDPQGLAKALSLSGKAQYEALDEVFEGIPQSAKDEAIEAIRAYKRADQARKAWLAHPDRTAEALKKADIQKQYQQLEEQKKQMEHYFDSAVKTLRDEGKMEVLQKTNDPDAKWWNDQADEIIDTAKKLSNMTDMSKVPIAFVLAASADKYRKLWLAERAQRSKSDKIINDRFSSEPNLSESGGNNGGRTSVDDMNKPFSEVFLKEFHKQRAAGAR